MTRRRDHTRKGFNLIEAAIVLGVVGFVIGGIWVAAAAVSQNMKVTEMVKDVLSTVNNTQNLISRATADSIGDTSITATIRNAGGFPANWVRGSQVKNVYNGSVSIRSIPNPNSRFDFVLNGLPRSACMNLIAAVSKHFSRQPGNPYLVGGLIAIQNPSAGWMISVFPYQPTGSECVASSNSLIFTFGYTRNN